MKFQCLWCRVTDYWEIITLIPNSLSGSPSLSLKASPPWSVYLTDTNLAPSIYRPIRVSLWKGKAVENAIQPLPCLYFPYTHNTFPYGEQWVWIITRPSGVYIIWGIILLSYHFLIDSLRLPFSHPAGLDIYASPVVSRHWHVWEVYVDQTHLDHCFISCQLYLLFYPQLWRTVLSRLSCFFILPMFHLKCELCMFFFLPWDFSESVGRTPRGHLGTHACTGKLIPH